MNVQPRSILLLVLASTGFALAPPFTFAADRPAQGDPITALLSEVHALRLTMERSAAVGPRVQLLVTRLNIEEQRTAKASAQLEQVRRQLADASLESKKITDELDEAERSLLSTAEERMKKVWEYEIGTLKRKLAAQTAVEQQLRARENDTAQVMATEQARWADLSARLDELERLLGPLPQQPR